MSENRLVLHNFSLFDGLNNALNIGKAIVILGNKIESIESNPNLTDFLDFQLVDLEGATVLPGLIDNHVHLTNTFTPRIPLDCISLVDRQTEKNLRCCLEAGITTVRDVGAIPTKIQRFRKRVDSGELPGPRILTTNSAITNLNGCPEWSPWPPRAELKEALGGVYTLRTADQNETEAAVRMLVDQDADWIKVYYQTKSWMFGNKRLPVFDWVTFGTLVNTARNLGRKVCCHISWLEDLRFVIAMGVHSVEHSVMEEIPAADINRMVELNVALVPTLAIFDIADISFWQRMEKQVAESGPRDFEPMPLKHIQQMIEFYLSGLYPESVEVEGAEAFFDIHMFQRNLPVARQNARRLMEAGGAVGVGTDSGGTPMAHFNIMYGEELDQLAQAGFSNFEILRAATSENARIIDMEASIGTIEKGKRADLTIVDGNPLEDIRAVGRVTAVYKDGRRVV